MQYSAFEERYEYLKLDSEVGADTFGFDRYLNQIFYQSEEWKQLRDRVIVRDGGCDLGMEGHEINGFWKNGKYIRPKILIHHMNPISLDDLDYHSDILLNPEYLITTIHETHNAIHYGDEALLITAPIERSRNDTCPWKRR